MRQLDEVKAQLVQITLWRSAVNDAQATLELYDLEPDDEMLSEAQSGLKQLRQGLDRWELERLLSGEYDKEGAVLSINAVSYTHPPSPRDATLCRMPASA